MKRASHLQIKNGISINSKSLEGVILYRYRSAMHTLRGESAAKLIEAVDHAAKSYPWPDTYKAFPGPNSNTFTAWIAKQVPGLGLDLPFSAIGSGYAETKN